MAKAQTKTTTKTRDPLTDPRRGDIVRDSRGRCRRVTARDTTKVTYQTSPDGQNWRLGPVCKLVTWAQWCRSAEAVATHKGNKPLAEAA